MQRSNFVIRVITGVFFVAIALYFAVYVYNAVMNPFQTTLAVTYTAAETIPVSGIVVRQETVIQAASTLVDVAVDEGAKLRVGGTVALVYGSEADLSAAAQLRAAQLQAEALQDALSQAETAGVGVGDRVSQLVLALEQGDLQTANAACTQIRTLLFSGTASEMEAELAALQTQMQSLQAAAASSISVVETPVGGVYSANVDGYESLTLEQVTAMTPAQLDAAMAQPGSVGEYVVGKVVSGTQWYLAAGMDVEDADLLRVGDSLDLRFPGDYDGTVTMEVVSIGPAEDGRQTVIFSSNHALADTLGMRLTEGEILLEEYSGIRVPKEAVRLTEDGVPCVYTVTAMKAEEKEITILYEGADYYIIQENEALREGDEIIVQGKDLYDGKILE